MNGELNMVCRCMLVDLLASTRRRPGRDGALVQVTVLDAVPDILDLTASIEGIIGRARHAYAVQGRDCTNNGGSRS